MDGSTKDMEINTKMNAGGVNSITPTRQRTTAASQPAQPGASFDSSHALEAALNRTPDVRPEAIDRARELINDPSYPSADTIKKLAGFFAAKLQSNLQ